MSSPLRGATAVVGIGQTPLYRRGTAPDGEMKLCLRAIVAQRTRGWVDGMSGSSSFRIRLAILPLARRGNGLSSSTT